MRPNMLARLSRMLAISVFAAALTTQFGCEFGREFREAAVPLVESGVKDIVNGMLDGLFAAIEPDDTTDGSSAGTGS